MAKFKTKHGGYGTKLYFVWTSMNYRTSNPNHHHYSRYGGRGITVCEEWRKDFAAFRDWALQNGYKEGMTLDRIDNDGNYDPTNCRWASRVEQNNNRSFNHLLSYNGETHTIAEWCRISGVQRGLFDTRLRRGWSIDRIISTPVKSCCKHKEVK